MAMWNIIDCTYGIRIVITLKNVGQSFLKVTRNAFLSCPFFAPPYPFLALLYLLCVFLQFSGYFEV